MNIVEATKKSRETGKWVYRAEYPGIIVKPTNSAWCCLVYGVFTGGDQGMRWNPTEDDLLADTWELTDERPAKYPAK